MSDEGNWKKHRQASIWLNGQQKHIYVDAQLTKVMRLLDAYGIETLFSCQGDDHFKDPTCQSSRRTRGYVLMMHDACSHDLISGMIENFLPFQPGRKSLWSVEFNHYKPHGNRVCIRFPNRHISIFEKYLKTVV